MARKRKHRVKTRRSGRFLGLYIFMTVLLAVLTIGAGSIIFFKVSNIEVYVRDSDGNTAALTEENLCKKEEIMSAAGIRQGLNLLLFSQSRAQEGIMVKVPYVSSVSVEKKFPDTLNILITESEAVATIQAEDKSWWLIDVKGKLLEQVKNKPNGILLSGLTLIEPKAGRVLQTPDGSKKGEQNQQLRKKGLLGVLPPLADYGMIDRVRSMDLSSESELVFDYDGRIKVKIALDANFDYQIKYFAKILSDYVEKNWLESDTGTLDMTYDDGHPHLTKNP